MASKGQALTIQYVAWDTLNNAGKTGDAANHTLRWVKDGTSGAPSNSPSEVDATNAPGVYKIVLTGSECDCNLGTLAGKSSTANVSIMPVTISFELLPTSLVGGRVDSSVGAMANDVLTAAAIATGAIDADALAADAGGEIADAVLDETTDTGYTLRQLMRGVAAALLGKLSGAATTTVTVRDAGDNKDRITATVDADGNRSAVTLDLT